jgi:hypothetical protein
MKARSGGRGVVGLALLGALVGCSSATPHPTGSPSPSDLAASASSGPSPSSSPTPASLPEPAAVAVIAMGSATTTLSLVDLGGQVLGSTDIGERQSAVEAIAPGGVDFTAAGRLHQLTLGGAVRDLGPLPYAGFSERFAVSPDGGSIAYARQVDMSGGSYRNQLWVDAIGAPPRLLADRQVTGTVHPTDAPVQWFYEVEAWTSRGIVIGRLPEGIGGYGPFIDEGYRQYTALVDPASGTPSPLTTGGGCPLSEYAHDGSFTCFRSGGDSGSGATSIELRRPGAAGTLTWPLPAAVFAGDARYDPTRGRLAYATVPVPAPQDDWQLHTTLRVLDLTTGQTRVPSGEGLQPLAWTRDGHLLAFRTETGPTTNQLRPLSLVSVDPTTGATQTFAHVGGDVAGVVSQPQS